MQLYIRNVSHGASFDTSKQKSDIHITLILLEEGATLVILKGLEHIVFSLSKEHTHVHVHLYNYKPHHNMFVDFHVGVPIKY